MAYFKQGSRQEEWTEDDDALYDDEYEDDEEYDEDYLTEEEQNDLRRYRFRMAAGLLDFLSVIAGTVVILPLAFAGRIFMLRKSHFTLKAISSS